ncbi:MAG: DUF167 domain-containing protein [Blastocatellia bacterium]
MVTLTANEDAITFAVRVQPRASRSQIAGELNGALKIRLAAPPVDGEANDELIRLLARLFDLPRGQIALLSGQTSKNKVVRVCGISRGACERILLEVLA